MNIDYIKWLLENYRLAVTAFDANPNEKTGFNKNLAAAMIGGYTIPIIEAYVAKAEADLAATGQPAIGDCGQGAG